jgi:hypothetical protein
MRGWAISPLMGPASQTNDVSCSDNPNVNKNGVPYLSKSVSTRPTDGQNDSGSETETQVATYPSSTVQAICAPAIDMLKNIKSFVDSLLF